MNTLKHTPGPWTAERGGAIVANGNVLATVQMGQQRNARLIAAAPELAEALRELVNGFDGETECTELLDKINTVARAALAKAGL